MQHEHTPLVRNRILTEVTVTGQTTIDCSGVITPNQSTPPQAIRLLGSAGDLTLVFPRPSSASPYWSPGTFHEYLELTVLLDYAMGGALHVKYSDSVSPVSLGTTTGKHAKLGFVYNADAPVLLWQKP